MLNTNIIQLRGTIFFKDNLGYSKANETKYRQFFPNSFAAPVVQMPLNLGLNRIQFFQQPQLEEGGPWQLIGGNTRFVFSQNKLDIIRDITASQGSVEHDFCTYCIEAFSSILKEDSKKVTRLAYAPLYAKDKDGSFTSVNLWKQLLTHPLYEGVDPEEVNLSFNYRIEKIVGKCKTLVNFKTVIGDASKQSPAGILIDGCVTISLDINTVIGQQDSVIVFDIEDLTSFFSEVPNWGLDFLKSNIVDL